jgi:hypothetical protein
MNESLNRWLAGRLEPKERSRQSLIDERERLHRRIKEIDEELARRDSRKP